MASTWSVQTPRPERVHFTAKKKKSKEKYNVTTSLMKDDFGDVEMGLS
jgi:hypothetical protein